MVVLVAALAAGADGKACGVPAFAVGAGHGLFASAEALGVPEALPLGVPAALLLADGVAAAPVVSPSDPRVVNSTTPTITATAATAASAAIVFRRSTRRAASRAPCLRCHSSYRRRA
jgi:hypothetical protein